MGAPLLEVSELSVAYSRGLSLRADTVAVRKVSFSVSRGETVGLIGESGAGKSTLLGAIAGLVKPAEGRILIEGRDIAKMSLRERIELRRNVAVLFQSAAVNPKMTVQDIVAEPLRNFEKLSRDEERRRVDSLLELAELPSGLALRYPSQLSGGQLRRASIARALALGPSLLLADEPVTSLDVSVRAQILDMLSALRDKLGLACVLVTHDLGVARHMCDSLCILRQGEIIERGDTAAIFNNPEQPYTKRLIESVLPVDTFSPEGAD